MSIKITSPQNPKIKLAVSLHKASVRKREGLFLIEGLREIRLAMQANYQFHTLFFCPSVADVPQADSIIAGLAGQAQIIETPGNIFSRLTYRERSDGLLLVARQKSLSLQNIHPGKLPLVLVVESVEKPGNLGAVLRTADAAGVGAVLVCNGITDIYNPNVIRSSLGTLFTSQVVCCSSEEAVKWLRSHNIRIFVTSLSASKPYYKACFNVPSAIVAGAEAAGVSAIWQDNSDERIIIPMFGSADSMNVSAATAIILYEALRQRGFGCRK